MPSIHLLSSRPILITQITIQGCTIYLISAKSRRINLESVIQQTFEPQPVVTLEGAQSKIPIECMCHQCTARSVWCTARSLEQFAKMSKLFHIIVLRIEISHF